MGALIAAFSLLTTLRLPRLSHPTSLPEEPAATAATAVTPVTPATPAPEELGRSVGFFPAVGLFLGLVAVGIGRALEARLPALLVALVVVAALAAITGGLHLDGLSDLFDGLGGGRGERERTLAIMRDSRIGAHGAVALILVLLAKVAAVAALLDAHELRGLLVAPVVARWAVTPQVVLFPCARADGLGRVFASRARLTDLVIATATTAALLLAPGAAATAKQAAVALAMSLLIGIWLRRRLHGLTGDVYGATIELCETGALIIAAMH